MNNAPFRKKNKGRHMTCVAAQFFISGVKYHLNCKENNTHQTFKLLFDGLKS